MSLFFPIRPPRPRRSSAHSRSPLAFFRLLACGALIAAARADEPTLPPPASVVLKSAGIRLEFSPELGRVMFFGRDGGGNLLWTNSPEALDEEYRKGGWRNYGGEKIWPGPQALWPYAQGRSWPPDPDFDGTGIERIESVSATGLTVTFPASRDWGVQLRRTFTLDPAEPVVRIRNVATRVAPCPVPLQIWSVAQLPHPRATWLESARSAPDGRACINLNRAPLKPPFTPPALPEGSVTVKGEWTRVSAIPEQRMKVGTLGGTIASATPDGLFVQTIPFAPEGMYPEASSVQVLLNPFYIEIETLSPLIDLAVGESVTFESNWALLPAVDADNAEACALALQKARADFGFPSE